ncbi:nucleotidyltransferase domain-containing protein [Thermococcus sp.]
MKLEDAVERILELGGNRVKFLILFGSHARGEAGKDSDIGLCVYYEGNPKGSGSWFLDTCRMNTTSRFSSSFRFISKGSASGEGFSSAGMRPSSTTSRMKRSRSGRTLRGITTTTSGWRR